MATSSARKLLLSRISSSFPQTPLSSPIFRSFGTKASSKSRDIPPPPPPPEERVVEYEEEIPTSGICRPLSEILENLSKKVPDSCIKVRSEDGFTNKYVPWHIVNRILNLHAPEWSGEVRSIVYSADGKSVTVVYRVTLYGTDAEIYRESSGTACVEDTRFGDPVQKAEAMAFRRACARLGLGLHLYHEDAL